MDRDKTIPVDIISIFFSQKKANSTPDTSTAPPKKPSGPKLPGDDKKKQHDALMDEFKKVHRKMFACQDGENVNDKNASSANDAIPVVSEVMV